MSSGEKSEDLSHAQHFHKVHPPSTSNMAFVPLTYTRPLLQVPVLCSRRQYIYLATLVMVIFILVFVRVMTQVKHTFVHYHMKSDSDAELVTLPLSYSSAKGAYCLDGSPPAYYYRPSPAADVKFWIIYLPGGAWCTSAKDCFERSLTDLGSSYAAQTLISFDGILSKDCEMNPDFCYWNVIVMLYCDGSSFLGNASAAVNFESQTLYLRGALIFDTIIEYLFEASDLRGAEQIVLAGSSAGGIGALIHADRLRARLPQSVKTLHVLVDGALFVDVPDTVGRNVTAETFKSVYEFHFLNSSASVQECSQTRRAGDDWRCLLPEVYHSFIFTPIFFINSAYDSWQRTNFLTIPCKAKVCPKLHIEAMNRMRDRIQNLARHIAKSRKNGVFLTSCPLHTLLIKPWFSDTELGDPTLQESVTSWLHHNEELRSLYVGPELQQAVENCQHILR